MRNIGELAKRKSKDGLNVLATLPTKLIEQGRYDDALQLENMSNDAIKGFEMPITLLCLYKAVENLEDRSHTNSTILTAARGRTSKDNKKSTRKKVDVITEMKVKIISNFVNHISSIIRLTFPMNALHDATTNILQNE